ncbi:MAG: Fe-S cluster assembly protein SufD, partial [Pseudomonadota bacterium]
MAATPDNKQLYLDTVTAVRAGLPGQSVPWARRLREEAATRFAELGFPTTRHEDWKYTNVSAIRRQLHVPAPVGASAGVGVAQLEALLFTDIAAHRLVFVNGRYAPSLSRVGAL